MRVTGENNQKERKPETRAKDPEWNRLKHLPQPEAREHYLILLPPLL